MEKNKTEKKQDTMQIVVNEKCVTLFFIPEPNHEAAGFIIKTLLNAYLIKAVQV